jgi:hypothetical protein
VAIFFAIKNESSSDAADLIQRERYPQGSPFLWVIKKRVAAKKKIPFRENAIRRVALFFCAI